jgi:hypothetical protein
MSSCLAIKNLNEKRSEPSSITHEHLPQPPFRLIVCGASHSGKSNMIKNMITLPEYGYSSYFGEDIFVFSKTLGLDDTWKSLKLPKTHLYSRWDEGVVREIMAYSKKQKNGTLFLLDDLISDGDAFNRKNSNLLSELFFCGRHYKISLCITTQKYHACQSSLLANASQIIVFRLKTKREKDAFEESMTMYDNLSEKYDYATKERFSFLYMNLTTGKIYRNFEEEL